MPNWLLNMDVVASSVPVGSATSSLMSKVTAAFASECLSLRFKVFCCNSFLDKNALKLKLNI